MEVYAWLIALIHRRENCPTGMIFRWVQKDDRTPWDNTVSVPLNFENLYSIWTRKNQILRWNYWIIKSNRFLKLTGFAKHIHIGRLHRWIPRTQFQKRHLLFKKPSFYFIFICINSQSINQSTYQSIHNQYTHRSIKSQSINQLINQLIDPTMESQSANQPINQSINQSIVTVRTWNMLIQKTNGRLIFSISLQSK